MLNQKSSFNTGADASGRPPEYYDLLTNYHVSFLSGVIVSKLDELKAALEYTRSTVGIDLSSSYNDGITALKIPDRGEQGHDYLVIVQKSTVSSAHVYHCPDVMDIGKATPQQLLKRETYLRSFSVEAPEDRLAFGKGLQGILLEKAKPEIRAEMERAINAYNNRAVINQSYQPAMWVLIP